MKKLVPLLQTLILMSRLRESSRRAVTVIKLRPKKSRRRKPAP
jgi:hypothetical protein